MDTIEDGAVTSTRQLYKNWNISRKFLYNLHRQFGTEPFTLKQAYVVYHEKHATTDGMYPWREANARTHLSAAAYLGVYNVVKVKRGIYRFTQTVQENAKYRRIE